MLVRIIRIATSLFWLRLLIACTTVRNALEPGSEQVLAWFKCGLAAIRHRLSNGCFPQINLVLSVTSIPGTLMTSR